MTELRCQGSQHAALRHFVYLCSVELVCSPPPPTAGCVSSQQERQGSTRTDQGHLEREHVARRDASAVLVGVGGRWVYYADKEEDWQGNQKWTSAQHIYVLVCRAHPPIHLMHFHPTPTHNMPTHVALQQPKTINKYLPCAPWRSAG